MMQVKRREEHNEASSHDAGILARPGLWMPAANRPQRASPGIATSCLLPRFGPRPAVMAAAFAHRPWLSLAAGSGALLLLCGLLWRLLSALRRRRQPSTPGSDSGAGRQLDGS